MQARSMSLDPSAFAPCALVHDEHAVGAADGCYEGEEEERANVATSAPVLAIALSYARARYEFVVTTRRTDRRSLTPA
jgi:hypothetical protein